MREVGRWAIEVAANLTTKKRKRRRLVREFAKLDPKVEQSMAKEGFGGPSSPPY